jgi:hypothetical protein
VTYREHLQANWKVAWKSLVMCLFHFAHGLVPCRWTAHEYWGVGGGEAEA